jgi:hypothetical protein
VSYVSISNFNHVTEVASLHVASHAELIFIIVISNQFKTGVKSTLTSQIKELGAIYTFGIKKLINLDKIQNENEIRNDGLALLAMRMPSDLRSSGLGSVQRRKRNELVLTRTRQMRKAVLNSVG